MKTWIAIALCLVAMQTFALAQEVSTDSGLTANSQPLNSEQAGDAAGRHEANAGEIRFLRNQRADSQGVRQPADGDDRRPSEPSGVGENVLRERLPRTADREVCASNLPERRRV